MGIGYLLGGIFCILYFLGVGILGGVKKSPVVLKLAKQKLGKTMSDEKAAKICLIMGIVLGLVGVFLFVFGAIQG
jgi:hypothetical protein